MGFSLSRRDLLEKCAAAGLLIFAPPLRAFEVAPFFEEGALALRKPTPSNELGPFYKKRAPRSGKLAPTGAPGLPLEVSGHIFDTRGAILAARCSRSGMPVTRASTTIRVIYTGDN